MAHSPGCRSHRAPLKAAHTGPGHHQAPAALVSGSADSPALEDLPWIRDLMASKDYTDLQVR